MGAKNKMAVTPAMRFLDAAGVTYTVHVYDYVPKGGTASAAQQLGVDEHAVVKTLVMEDGDKNPLIVLMHGDRMVSTRQLARVLGVKHIGPCHPDTAQKHSGYQVGGTSPFGTRKTMPIYLERSVLDQAHVFINGGHRGVQVRIDPADLVRVLNPTLVDVAMDEKADSG